MWEESIKEENKVEETSKYADDEPLKDHEDIEHEFNTTSSNQIAKIPLWLEQQLKRMAQLFQYTKAFLEVILACAQIKPKGKKKPKIKSHITIDASSSHIL